MYCYYTRSSTDECSSVQTKRDAKWCCHKSQGLETTSHPPPPGGALEGGDVGKNVRVGVSVGWNMEKEEEEREKRGQARKEGGGRRRRKTR